MDRLESQPEQALPYARTLAQEDPFDDTTRARLLGLLAAAGRRPEAEQQFEAGLRVLQQAGVGSTALIATWRALKQDTKPHHGGETRPTAATGPAPDPMPRVNSSPMPSHAPMLVGRQAEVQRLLAALDEVEDGGGRGAPGGAVLLTGEPGLGKSALIAELARAVAARGGSVLSGRAYEAERDRPFGPWIEALDGLPLALIEAAPTPPRRRDLLGRREDRMLARERLFASIVEQIAECARERPPLLMILEDAHWMDEASAALLHHAVRAPRRAPVLVALSVRDGELPDNPPVLGVLRSLRHERLLEIIALSPLSLEATEALVRSIAPGADTRRLAAESGGNPLLAQELARARLDGAEQEGVPRTLRDLVRDRIERLPAASAELLRWAAVLGPADVSVERLGELVPMELPDFMAALETLERHALLQAGTTDDIGVGSGGYAFRHDLIRRAVYTGLSEPRRRLMHQKIAQALRRRSDPGDGAVAAGIAHHAVLAGDAGLAAEACLAAGRRCLRLLAGAEAGILAQRGLRYAEALREPDRTCLMLDLLQIQLAANRPANPVEAARLIEDLAQRALDHDCLEHARLGFHMLSHLRWEGGLWSEAERDTLRAELVSRSADERERVVAMAEAARCLALLGRDLGQAEALTIEATALAGRLGTEPNAIADALGLLRLHQGAEEEAAGLFERARIGARRDGDRASEFLALEHRVGLEIRRGRFGDAGVLCTALAELAGRLRQDGSEAPCARALVALCRLAALCSDAEAETELENALTALTAADAKHRLAFALVTAAELDLRASRFASARVRAEEGLRLSSLLDLPSEVAAARATLVRVAAASEDAAECRLQVKALRSMRGRDLSRHARDLAEALCAEAAEGGG